MAEKTWTDQPDDCERGEKLVHGSSRDGAWEIRHEPSGKCYVTHGNLFGSETVACASLYVACRVLDLFLNHPRAAKVPPPKLPTGATLLTDD